MKKQATLTPQSYAILVEQATEAPDTGQYLTPSKAKGTFICRGCGYALYREQAHFASSCGWPSFDDDIQGHVVQRADSDGRRTEIICSHCQGHLGHVFTGEGLTEKNTRHCVNAAAIEFVEHTGFTHTEEAIVAGGCFWGVEHLFRKLPGVLLTQVGYTGGELVDPSYEAVCRGDSGHYEAVRIVFDPQVISYESIIKYFFEIHDPEQASGQGNDIGQRYRSAIFYFDDHQKALAESVISQLASLGFNATTKIFPANVFWPAELYHQLYYMKNSQQPYCHTYTKRFAD